MKKTITFLCAGFLTLGLSAQNFGVGLDYMMLSGTMIADADGNAVMYKANDEDTEMTEVGSSSAVLNLSYDYSINDDMSAVLSAGYGMGFGIVPLKASLSYGFSPSISANVGMGMYMITDASYVPEEGTFGDDEFTASSNEFGGGAGIAYHMNNIGIGLGYEMIKGTDNAKSLNSFTIGLSYSFGGGSGGDSAPAAPAGK
ncbi:MAG: hypothetical protein CMD16_02395 [Flavobacteriales bacterium]|nr:hypothetical protein [Flavobacteriales bacterium]|tara:strand:- start:12972 stop:13571 length:600 start_codon:yes stop_codon:yes gene_type:complete